MERTKLSRKQESSNKQAYENPLSEGFFINYTFEVEKQYQVEDIFHSLVSA